MIYDEYYMYNKPYIHHAYISTFTRAFTKIKKLPMGLIHGNGDGRTMEYELIKVQWDT